MTDLLGTHARRLALHVVLVYPYPGHQTTCASSEKIRLHNLPGNPFLPRF